MSTSTTYIGLDAHKDTIVAAIYYPRRKKPELVELANTEQSLRRSPHAPLQVFRRPSLRRKSLRAPPRKTLEWSLAPASFDNRRRP